MRRALLAGGAWGALVAREAVRRRVVRQLLEAEVDDEGGVGDGDGRLGEVGREDDLRRRSTAGSSGRLARGRLRPGG